VAASVAEIERELAGLRAAELADETMLRTSVLTHIAWAPAEWRDQAAGTLAGLAERHPSRTILAFPEPDADEDAIRAEVDLRCFSLPGQEHHVCSEVIELHLLGRRCEAPASVLAPLLIVDLPAFLRWRGPPPFGEPAFEGLADLVDRLVVDSAEWPGPAEGDRALAAYFDRVAVSDIGWARTRPWRAAVAELWPDVAEARGLRARGPLAEALLLAGWLRSRLRRSVELEHEPADELERVSVDGRDAVPAPGPRPSGSDLLSEELDRFGRDPVYEAAAQAV
jgi:glucose-6-phosphate dehydrogenase assembly protein OpcA